MYIATLYVRDNLHERSAEQSLEERLDVVHDTHRDVGPRSLRPYQSPERGSINACGSGAD